MDIDERRIDMNFRGCMIRIIFMFLFVSPLITFAEGNKPNVLLIISDDLRDNKKQQTYDVS